MPFFEQARFFYSGDRLRTERYDGQSRSTLAHGIVTLAQQWNRNDEGCTELLASDAQSSVLASHGPDVLQFFTYSGYGYVNAVALMPIASFTGQRLDPASGCYLLGNGYRSYNPRLMRFHSADNLSPFAAGGLNAYAYCRSNPINYSDPSGHMRLSALVPDFLPDTFKKRLPQVFQAKNYRPAARDAIAKNPDLGKYQVIVDDPQATQLLLRKIKRIPQYRSALEELLPAAQHDHFIAVSVDVLETKLEAATRMLDSFTPSTGPTPQRTETPTTTTPRGSPVTENRIVRGRDNWETFNS